MKTARILVYVLASLTSFLAYGQAQVSQDEAATKVEELCRTILCREPTTVRVLREDGSLLEVPIRLRLPYIQPSGWLTIFPGEELHVEVEIADESIVNPRVVKKPQNFARTISFRFWQETANKDSFLLVTNPFPRHIRFNLGMMLPTDEGLRKTTSCPARANLKHIEHWPHPIFQLVVANIRFLPPGADLKCEY